MNPRLDAIWRLLERDRASGHAGSTADVVQRAHREGLVVEVDDLWDIGGRFGRSGYEPLVPPVLSRFIAAMFQGRRVRSVLDPWVGFGSLLGPVARAVHAERVVGRFPQSDVIAAVSILLPGADIQVQADEDSASQADRFDAVVSCPPFGAPARQFTLRGVSFNDTRGHETLVRAADQLAHDGLGAFVVAPSFLWVGGPNRVLNRLGAVGLTVSAIFDVPAGVFQPHTAIPTMVVVIERGAGDGTVFVGSIQGDEKHVDLLLANFWRRKPGPRPESGAVVPLEGYRGFRSLVARREVDLLSKRMGGTEVRLGDIATMTRLRTREDLPPDDPNGFYLPLTAGSALKVSREDLPKGVTHHVHIAVDPTKAAAATVVGVLESPLGVLLREAVATGAVLPRLSVREVMDLGIPLPPHATQIKVAETSRRIRALQDELRDLNETLWAKPARVREVAESLERVNHGDAFQEWIDTLPYPLASVLWTYHTLKDPHKRVIQIDHFFEALAQYLAVVLMSGLHADRPAFDREWDGVQRALSRERMTLKRATFGTWLAVHQHLAKALRPGLSGDRDTRTYWTRLFAVEDERLLASLLSGDLVKVLQTANKYRNDWRGHGGVVGDEEAERRHALFADLLGDVRHLVGRRWSGWPLVLPVSSRFVKGVHRTTVRLVVGTRTPFEVAEYDLQHPLEHGRLHMVNPAGGGVCALLPFVKLGASPRDEQNACYFFNRVDPEGPRWVSFHFEKQPDMVERADDLMSVLDALAPPAAAT